MQVKTLRAPLGRLGDQALVLFAAKDAPPLAEAAQAGAGHGRALKALVERKAFQGGAGQVQVLPGGARERVGTLVVVGLGDVRTLDGEGLRQAAGAGARAARQAGARSVSLLLPRARGLRMRPEALAEALVDGAVCGLYRFEAHKSKPSEDAVERLTVVSGREPARAVARGAERGRILGECVCFARTLGNEPGNVCTPAWLGERALELAAQWGLKVHVMDEAEMRERKMGALLGVAQGSAQPPRLIVLTWEPPGKGRVPTVALVGKGLTFDTGGISIKPAAKLEDMKFDMCGGAAVLAAMQAVARLGVGVRVVGLVPASENMPGGRSYKPGDILKASNGVTIEIRNTDAEGRLILADALAYASGTLKPRPKALIDLATLTGACVVALGEHHAGMVSNDDALAARLERASRRAADPLWRLPLVEGHRKQMESPYADLSNLGTPGAGALTAAAFLERFTGGLPWAHLDIAGVAWTEKNAGHLTKGATGYGVRVLARLLEDWA